MKITKYKNIENLASVLKNARLSKNMTQQQLAKLVKTKQTSISRMENGNISSIRFAEKVATALGYSLRFNHITLENNQGSISSFTEQR